MSLRVGPQAPITAPTTGKTPTVARKPVARVDSFEAPRPAAAPSLMRGMMGGAVRALQQRLVARGYLSRSDMATGAGVFGPRTEAAVRKFQTLAGLKATGVANAATQAALAEKPKMVAIDETPTDRFISPPAAANDDESTTPMGNSLEVTQA